VDANLIPVQNNTCPGRIADRQWELTEAARRGSNLEEGTCA